MIKQFYLTHRWNPNRYYLVRVDLGAISMKRYSTFPKVPGLKPHHQMFFISYPWGKGSYPSLQRYSWHILQPQPVFKENFARSLWDDICRQARTCLNVINHLITVKRKEVILEETFFIGDF